MKKPTPLQQAKAEVKALTKTVQDGLRVLGTTELELRSVIQDLEIEKRRTERKEATLKDIFDVTSGLYNSHMTDNKVVTFELIGSVSRMAQSEMTYVKDPLQETITTVTD